MATFEQPQVPSEEPIGIVISRGASVHTMPRVVAYVWAEAPEGERVPARDKAS